MKGLNMDQLEMDVLVLQLECDAEWEKYYEELLAKNIMVQEFIVTMKPVFYDFFKSGYAKGASSAYSAAARNFKNIMEKVKNENGH
jgi:hypothetical protein